MKPRLVWIKYGTGKFRANAGSVGVSADWCNGKCWVSVSAIQSFHERNRVKGMVRAEGNLRALLLSALKDLECEVRA